jgi:hypothetical protein
LRFFLWYTNDDCGWKYLTLSGAGSGNAALGIFAGLIEDV